MTKTNKLYQLWLMQLTELVVLVFCLSRSCMAVGPELAKFRPALGKFEYNIHTSTNLLSWNDADATCKSVGGHLPGEEDFEALHSYFGDGQQTHFPVGYTWNEHEWRNLYTGEKLSKDLVPKIAGGFCLSFDFPASSPTGSNKETCSASAQDCSQPIFRKYVCVMLKADPQTCDDFPCADSSTCLRIHVEEYKCADGSYCLQSGNRYGCSDGSDCGRVPVEKFECVCKPGTTGEFCKGDVDECELGSHLCVDGTVCKNTFGSYNCSPGNPTNVSKNHGVSTLHSLLLTTKNPLIERETRKLNDGYEISKETENSKKAQEKNSLKWPIITTVAIVIGGVIVLGVFGKVCYDLNRG